MDSQTVCCGLRHGIDLMVADTSGRLKAEDIAAFLGEALQHFKRHRDTLQTQLYTGGPCPRKIKQGRRTIGSLQLNYPGDGDDCLGDYLPPRLWVDAVADAYAVADTLGQMADELAAFRADDVEGSLRVVLDQLERPGGTLKALELMLEKSLKSDRETGVYVPGLTTKGARSNRGSPS
jgi:hypothetical protein